MEKSIINSDLDMHLHLRDDDMLKLVASLTPKSFAGALIMPNLLPPITAGCGTCFIYWLLDLITNI
ncbi:truncated dihydroorotase [Arcobacter sp. L]|nr:truncated dihydroorotase [Arcobacter sp. L]